MECLTNVEEIFMDVASEITTKRRERGVESREDGRGGLVTFNDLERKQENRA